MSRMRLLNESSGQTFEGFCLIKSASVKTNIKRARSISTLS